MQTSLFASRSLSGGSSTGGPNRQALQLQGRRHGRECCPAALHHGPHKVNDTTQKGLGHRHRSGTHANKAALLLHPQPPPLPGPSPPCCPCADNAQPQPCLDASCSHCHAKRQSCFYACASWASGPLRHRARERAWAQVVTPPEQGSRPELTHILRGELLS